MRGQRTATTTTPPPTTQNVAIALELTTASSPLAIDGSESPEMRIQRLVSENPVVIFARSSCCMCHVMKNLLATVGVHPTVIELEEVEIRGLGGDDSAAPVLFVGGSRVGGLEGLVGLHLGGQLVPRLVEVGALAKN
uniref:Glutaredoxin domain-containing protein n=1 Tax=Kalanchoe fedtschenkoi TaxID=63787 RepID=A0A7N0UTA0_KALFE